MGANSLNEIAYSAVRRRRMREFVVLDEDMLR